MKKLISLLLSLLLLLSVFPVSAEEASADGETLVTALLEEQAAKQKDVWVLAILEAGAKDISLRDGTLNFSLRSFNPNLKELGAYSKAGDPDAWRQQMMDNLSAWNLSFSVPLAKDGTIAKKQKTQFLNDVKKYAGSAKAAFGQKDFAAALKDLLFCSPTDAKKVTGANLLLVTDEFASFIQARPELFPCETPAEWAPVFYAQRAFKVNPVQGPHRIKLTWDGVNMNTLLNQAYDAASLDLASVPAAERLSRENLPVLWRSKLAETSVTLTSKKLTNQSAAFDIDDLAAGNLPEDYVTYFSLYRPSESYDKLTAAYDLMPAEACESFPKTGAITKAARGRSVTIIVPKDGRNTYVQFRDADTGVIRGDACIAPGKNINLKIPEGTYVVQFATGSSWYGLNGLFGPAGNYTASDPITVAKAKWKLTSETEQEGFTLHPAAVEDFVATEDQSVWIKGVLEAQTPLLESYPENNPVEEGVHPLTGLPTTEESYTPIVMVLDNAEDAYPHWGVSQADMIFQIPNAGSGVTKLLGLFATNYPDQAGPVRSGRASMLPVALAFDAAFAFAGPPAAAKGDNVNLDELLKTMRFSTRHRSYDLLHSDTFKERRQDLTGPAAVHNLSCHVSAIHENLVTKEVEFDKRPFLFTDEARTDGEIANNIRVLHRGENRDSGSNSASRAVFNYDAATGQYSRTNSSGLYTDRNTGENVTFANVIVLRVGFGWEDGYVYLKNHMVGSGCIEVFQSGRYIRGAWHRTGRDARLILTDADGSELKLQRGKTFIVVTNDITDVVYTE